MSESTIGSLSTTSTKPVVQPSEASWTAIYRVGAAAATAILILMPIQIAIFVVWPPPETVGDFFVLLRDNWLNLDLLYVFTNVLMLPVFLALCVALRRVSPSAIALALVLGLVSIATYFSSNPSFEMLSLSNRYAAATSDAERSIFLAAGEAMLATNNGTAFDIYYVMNGVALIIISAVMLRSSVFSKATAYAGLLSGALMLVPSSAGAIGLVFSLVSLIPWAVFSVLIARRLFRIGLDVPQPQHTAR